MAPLSPSKKSLFLNNSNDDSSSNSNDNTYRATLAILDTTTWYCSIIIIALILFTTFKDTLPSEYYEEDQYYYYYYNESNNNNNNNIFSPATKLVGPSWARHEGRPCDEIYVVGEGETLHTISDKCHDPFIVERNPHIHDPDDVFPGLVIKIVPSLVR